MPTTEKVNVIITGQDKSKQAFNSAGQGASSLTKKIGSLAAVAIPALAVAMGVKAVNAAMEWETAMSNINTLMNDQGESVKALELGIEDMMRRVPKSGKELGASAYAIVSAGISDTAHALNVLEESANLAVAGLGTTEEATDLMTSAINAFGLNAEEAGGVANTFFLAVKSGKTTVSELAQGFGQIAPLASQMGVSLEDLMATTAALTTGGQKASIVYSSLKGAFSNMLKPTKDMQEVMDRAGLTFDDVQKSLAGDGLVKTIRMMTDAAGGNTDEVAKMFGSVEGLNSVLALMNETGEVAIKNLDSMTENTDAMTIAVDKQNKTASKQYQLLKNEFNIILRKLGEKILPFVTAALYAVVDMLNGMGDALKITWTVIKTFMDGFVGFISLIWDGVTALGALIGISGGVKEMSEGPMSVATEMDLMNMSIATAEDLIKQTTDTGVKGFDDTEKAIGGAGGAVESLGEKLKELKTEYEDLTTSIIELEAKKNRDTLAINQQFAEAIVEQQEKIARIKEQIREATESEERQLLQRQLELEQEALSSQKINAEQLATEIDEVKRRNALTDFERTVEDINLKHTLMLNAFSAKKKVLEDELKINEDKRIALQEIEESITSVAVSESIARQNAVISSNNAMMQSYLELQSIAQSSFMTIAPPAQSMMPPPTHYQSGGFVNAPLGSAVPAIVHGGERIIPAGGRQNGSLTGGGITVNINGGMYLSEDVALEIGDMIIDRLKLQLRV